MITVQDIENVIAARGNAREHLMAILRDLENLSGRNVLDVSVLNTLAMKMDLPQSAISGFTSFYTMFSTEPRAKFIIRVCKSGPCHVMGACTIFDVIENHLGIRAGETTADGLFHLEECECLGLCSAAPAMMVNYDMHGNLTESNIKEILDSYSAREPAFKAEYGPGIEGRAVVINNSQQTRRLLENVGRLDPANIESYLQNGGYEAARKAFAEYSPEQVIGIVKDSGLRGRGGAGFPVGVKWSFVPKGEMQKYVICNADEGEPGTFKDRVLMEENPQQLIEGMLLCGYAIGATLGYIYVRGEYRRSIERLQSAIDQARAKGFLGKKIFGSNFDFDIFVKEGGGAYVCGEETSLINSMEGKRGYPRVRPPFPAAAGFMGMPSNVNNVETLSSIPMIVARGADWFKSVGTATCAGTKLYCLSGKVNQTGLVELPMGATLRQMIDTFGGGMKSGSSFKFAQVGGAAGGILGADLMDLPLDIDSTIKAGVTLGSGVVLVCDQETCAVDFLLNALNFFEHESCGQCIPCKLGTSQLHYVAQKFAMREAEEKDIQLMIDTAKMMKLASLCALGQSPILPIETMIRNFREEFVKHCDPDYECPQCDASLQAYYL